MTDAFVFLAVQNFKSATPAQSIRQNDTSVAL